MNGTASRRRPAHTASVLAVCALLATGHPLQAQDNDPDAGSPAPSAEQQAGAEQEAAQAAEEQAAQRNVPQLIVSDRPPPGFEDIESGVETLFDVVFAGVRIGSSNASLENGTVIFRDPQGVAALFPEVIDRTRLLQLLDQPLDANESLRCLPGRTSGCGILAPGQAGVIANPENFTIEVFLPNSYFSEADGAPRFLGDPVSGPSLLQTAQLSVSTQRNNLGSVRYGATLNTNASIGRTSFEAQTFLRDQGGNLQTASLRHIWDDRFAGAGLMQDDRSLTFRSFRVAGAEFGSFFGARLDNAQGLSTPIEIILPRAARVEVYRDSVLIQTFQMEAGLQTINTAGFPAGSYPIRILALDGDMIVLDETRVFTRVSDLPPEDVVAFRLRAGMRIRETGFGNFIDQTDQPFFPEISDEPVISAQLGKRVGSASAVEAQVLMVDDDVFGELAFTTYRNRLTGFVGVSAGSDGSYSGVLSGNLRTNWASFSLSARHTRLNDQLDDPAIFRRDFRPYFRSEDLVSASASLPVGPGVFSLTGTYSKSPDLDDRYSIGARYNMPIEIGGLGQARLSLFGFQTDRDTRAGLTITFFRRLSPRTNAYYGGGVEYRDRSDDALSDQPEGIFPIVEGRVTRSMDWGNADVLASAGASTDADRHRAFASLDLASNYGLADILVEYEDRRGPGGQDGVSIAGNAFSGFVIGGGSARLGLREFGGDAAVLIDVDRSGIPESYREDITEEGNFTVFVDNREVGQFDADGSTTVILPSLREYSIQLQPENAPPYLIDLTRRNLALWPGNVARLSYEAQLAVTLFGRLVDPSGNALGNARIRVGTASTITDSQGYFLITGTLDDEIVPFFNAEMPCRARPVSQLVEGVSGEEYFRIGELVCEPEGQ